MQALTLDKSGLERYMAEISRYQVLSREQELHFARQYSLNGDIRAVHSLVLANLRFVVKIAYEYRSYGLKLLDLIQEGNMGLMIAVKKFDPEKGYRLISYAVWWIRAQMQSFIMRSWSLVKFGSSKLQRKLFFKLRGIRARAQAAANDAETVTTATIARELDASEPEVIYMESRLAARDFSLDASFEEGGTTTRMDMLTHNTDTAPLNPEEALTQTQSMSQLRQQVTGLLQELNEKERTIVEQRLLADEPKTLAEIGGHFMISRERVRQLEKRVREKLRVRMDALSTP